MGTCGQPGYVFRDFCLKQGIFSLDDKQPARMIYELNYSRFFFGFGLNVLNRQGIKNRNSVLNRVGRTAIFVLNSIRV